MPTPKKGLTASQRRIIAEEKLKIKSRAKNKFQANLNEVSIGRKNGGGLTKGNRAFLKKLKANASAVSKKANAKKMANYDESTKYDQLKNKSSKPRSFSKLEMAVRKKNRGGTTKSKPTKKK
tara:strand:- start:1010 stop:1375 length:366 start_codon:yes stop_codon:yes gene_type:complete